MEREMIAEFDQNRNDMHWKVYASPDGFIRWTGYDDAYWWDNVSKTDGARDRVGKVSGNLYRLDPVTNRVEIQRKG